MHTFFCAQHALVLQIALLFPMVILKYLLRVQMKLHSTFIYSIRRMGYSNIIRINGEPRLLEEIDQPSATR